MDSSNIEAIETCCGCPHSFEFKIGDKLVGCLRFRWGHLQLWPELDTDESYRDNIFDYYSEDEYLGMLPSDREEMILNDCKRMLSEYWNTHQDEVVSEITENNLWSGW